LKGIQDCQLRTGYLCPANGYYNTPYNSDTFSAGRKGRARK
jgi:hypothetical protein